MAKLLPKKILDEEIAAKLASYYKLDDRSFDSRDLLDWECFSHPSLELHECNSRSLLPGRHACKSCGNKPGKVCDISCDIQNFCLAVYAWRMGIGGEDFDAAMDNNLYKLRPEALYAKVIKTFSKEELEEVVVKNEIAIPAFVKDSEEEEPVELSSRNKRMSEAKNSALESKNGDDLLTIQEAAEDYGCTYANIYNYVKNGRIPSLKDSGKVKVKRSALDLFKSRTHGKRKPSTKERANYGS